MIPWEIDVHAVKALMDQNSQFLFLDCREPEEFAYARIAGTQLIPMQQISARLSELDPYRDQRIVVHCHHGGRSLRVVEWLRQQGFDSAQNMTGGIELWSREIDSSIPRY